MSLYYHATRSRPLQQDEAGTIRSLIQKHSVDKGPSWESFLVYDPAQPTKPGVVFEGATGLPSSSEEDLWGAVQLWCALLTEIRRQFPDATWSLRLDDHDIHWDPDRREYDPSV